MKGFILLEMFYKIDNRRLFRISNRNDFIPENHLVKVFRISLADTFKFIHNVVESMVNIFSRFPKHERLSGRRERKRRKSTFRRVQSGERGRKPLFLPREMIAVIE